MGDKSPKDKANNQKKKTAAQAKKVTIKAASAPKAAVKADKK